jgi:hypothetical protein
LRNSISVSGNTQYISGFIFRPRVKNPIGIGGPSVGNGMLFVTTGQTFTIGANSGGGLLAFGLPEAE